MTDPDLMRFARHRDETANMAARYGWQIPADYAKLRGIAIAARNVAQQQPAPDPVPTKAGDVAKWCDRQAAARVHHTERVRVAAELAETHELAATRGILREIPGTFLPALVAAQEPCSARVGSCADQPRLRGALQQFVNEVRASADRYRAPRKLTT